MKKYIFAICASVFMFIGLSIVHADEDDVITCYYKNDKELMTMISFKPGAFKHAIPTTHSFGGDQKTRSGSIVNAGLLDSNDYYNTCPKYAIGYKTLWSRDILYTDNFTIVQAQLANDKKARYAASVSADEYWGLDPCEGEGCIKGEDVTLNCENAELFGRINDAGYTYTNSEGETVESPPSLAYLINRVMTVVRIVVPILIIGLGSFDLAKAVIASKPDEMKKAQTTLFKRIIAGICVFFVPVLVNIVMSLADIVWEGTDYESCRYETIMKNK